MTVRFRLEDCPPALRARIEAQLAREAAGKPEPEPPAAPARELVRQTRARQPNKTEAAYNRAHLGGRGLYEAVTFRLPGGSRYTPDWITFDSDGRMTAHEIKGSYRHHSQGRAATAFREAVAAFPHVTFIWACRRGGEWLIQTCKAEPG